MCSSYTNPRVVEERNAELFLEVAPLPPQARVLHPARSMSNSILTGIIVTTTVTLDHDPAHATRTHATRTHTTRGRSRTHATPTLITAPKDRIALVTAQNHHQVAARDLHLETVATILAVAVTPYVRRS